MKDGASFSLSGRRRQRQSHNRILLPLIWSLGWVGTTATSTPATTIKYTATDFTRHFTLEAFPRGGDITPEDQELDEYIEQLVSLVSSSEDDEAKEGGTIHVEKHDANDVDRDAEPILVVVGKVKGEDQQHLPNASKGRESETPEGEIESVDDTNFQIEEENNELSPQLDANMSSDEPEEIESTGQASETPRIQMEPAIGDEEESSNLPDDIDINDRKDEENSPLVEAPTSVLSFRRPPNAVYRFFLRQGRLGHVFVLMCILVVEWIQRYLPPVATLFHALATLVFGSDADSTMTATSYEGDSRRPLTDNQVHAQYAAFVSPSRGTSSRGKAQVRNADQQAAEKLRQIGSVQDAKYRHVSQDFCKRHGIGPYRNAEATSLQSTDEMTTGRMVSVTTTGEDGEENDVDWVVEALTKEVKTTPKRPIETSVSLGMGSAGPSVTVGVEFGLGGSSLSSRTKKRRHNTLVEAATQVSARTKAVPVGPRASDRDGGGGVMGRLRAAGANSLMSRSLLGAYPGDAVPPNEAASATGVTALAKKYGYGEWSDDEEAEDDWVTPQKSSQRDGDKKRKRKKSSSSEVSMMDLELSSSRSKLSDDRPATRTKIRRKKSSRKSTDDGDNSTPSTTGSVVPKSDILSSSEPRKRRKVLIQQTPAESTKSDIFSTGKLPKRREVLIRRPMERLNEARDKLKPKAEDDE